MAADYGSALKWPIVSWVVVDVIFLLTSYVEGVMAMITPEAVAPLAVAFGIWAGYKIVELGGGYGDALGAGVIVGLVCAVLTILGFGVIRAMGVGATFPLAVFALTFNIAGALVGGGFALTRKAAPTM